MGGDGRREGKKLPKNTRISFEEEDGYLATRPLAGGAQYQCEQLMRCMCRACNTPAIWGVRIMHTTANSNC